MNQNRPASRHPWRFESRALLLLGLATGLVWAFADLAEDAMTGESHSFDRMVLMALRTQGELSHPVGPDWMLPMFRDITALGGATVITLVTALSISYLLVAGRRMLAGLLFGSVVGATLLESTMKTIFDRARPDIVPHLVQVHDPSFPSGHAMLSTVAYLTIALLLARTEPPGIRALLLAAAVFIAFIIGASRVYLGVHWPTDVVAGWTAGTLWVLGVWLIASKFVKPDS